MEKLTLTLAFYKALCAAVEDGHLKSFKSGAKGMMVHVLNNIENVDFDEPINASEMVHFFLKSTKRWQTTDWPLRHW